MRRHTLRFGLVTAVCAATAAFASPAYADVNASAYISLGTLTFVDKPGAYDLNLVVRTSGTTVTFDATYTVTPFAGCTRPDPADVTLVACSGTFADMAVYGGDGNDRIDLDLPGLPSTIVPTLWGEGGNDVILGSYLHELLYGGPGNDELRGRFGNDGLRGGPGADLLYGGIGSDGVAYVDEATAGVHATADGVIGDDGMAGEGDTIGSDVENLIGSHYDDVIGGNAAENYVMACGGADTIRTYGGDDLIEEGDGGQCGEDPASPLRPDYVDGGSGSDFAHYLGNRPTGVRVTLDDAIGNDGAPGEGDSLIGIENIRASSSDDILIGNAASNTLYGGGGDDTIFGLDGADTLLGMWGDDTIYGGNGDDRLIGDVGDDSLNGNSGTDYCHLGSDGGSSTSCEL